MSPPLSPAGPSALPLLVVDDDALLRGMAERTLRHAGFEVIGVDGGEAALEALAESRFALVLLDVVMPDMDGYEVCRRLRTLPEGSAIPVLMLTGLNDTESIGQAYAAGATDFISKPINWTLLAERVRYALRAAAAAQEAQRNRQRLERAQTIARMGSWELEAAGLRMSCSKELASIFAAPPQAPSCISPDAFLERVHIDDRPRVQAARGSALHEGRAYQMNFRIVRFDGVERTVFEQAQAHADAQGRVRLVEGITQDITERVEAERRISRLSHFDPVTELPNRQFFLELASPALERAARLGSTCALLHVDVDRFKAVNDAVGRAEGDRVLRVLAERLKASVRVADIAATGAAPQASQGCLARVGANAFTLLLVEAGGERDVALIADRLMAAVALPIEAEGRELALSASVGIAMYPRDAAEPRAMARCAEQAAYAAKASGRAQRRFFDAQMDEAASNRLTRESELRRGIAEGQLRLFYQPKVHALTGRIVGAEALVRWLHPAHGLLPPAEFIPLAEECDLIVTLTDWVLETACRHLRGRLDEGLPAVPVSVNLASPSFVGGGLAEQLDELLARYGLEPGSLTLEVTESMLMRDTEQAASRLQQLRERGFRLSLDDFGTGYSSLMYLKEFPVDELKIDRSFVRESSRGGRDSAIARSIIALGREFGLQVVAEGVETVSEANFLVKSGCTTQQGFLYARPMPAAQFDALLRDGGGMVSTTCFGEVPTA